MVRTGKQVFTSKEMIFRRVDSIDYQTGAGPTKALVLRLQNSDRDVEIHIRFAIRQGLTGFTCVTQFKNRSTETKVIHSIDPFVLDVANELRIFTGDSTGDLVFFKNGLYSWDLTQTRPIEPGISRSHLFSVIHNRATRSTFLAGFTTSTEQISFINLRGTEDEDCRLDRVSAVCELDNIRLQAGASVMSEELLVLVGTDPHHMIKEYTELTANKMKAVGCDDPLTGWCSWYYYYSNPDQYEIVRNADAVRERFPDVEWIQLDDGYQRAVGDWTANERFGNGLEALVKKINERGLRAGVWVAPFIASKYSNFFKDHPHWFIRDRDNEPIPVGNNPLWYGEYYALDLTEPSVIQFIKDLFKQLRSFGFELFKIDFLYHEVPNGVRHDESKTHAQALRDGLLAIREAVGDSIIFASGAPLGPCIGIANIMRIGTDIGTKWRYDWGGGVYECAINTMTRAFLNGRWWTNDPDCIIVRQDDNDLTLDEIQLWLTIVAMSGGTVHLSEKMEEVAEERFRLVDKILPPYGRGSTTIDVFTEEEPRVFAQRIETPRGAWALVALVNLSEKEISVKTDLAALGMTEPGPHHLFEFWSRQYEGTVEDDILVTGIKPHSCRLYIVKPESATPSILSTSIHFTQGAVELKDERWNDTNNELTVTITRDTLHAEMVFVVFGPMWRPRHAYVNDESVEFIKVAPEVIAVRRQFRAGEEIRVGFSKME